MRSKKLKILFDFDGTVSKVETIPYVAEQMGVMNYQDIETLTTASFSAEDDYEQNLRKRIEMMKDISVNDFLENIHNGLLRSEIVRFIQDNSDICEIVSCNLDCWCLPVTLELNVPCHFSQAQVVDDYVVGLETVLNKEMIVNEYKNQGFDVVFVGDSANDFKAMKKADMAIIFDNGRMNAFDMIPNCKFVKTEPELLEVLETILNSNEL